MLKADSSGFLLRRRRHAGVSVLKFDGVSGDMLPRSDSFNGYGFAFGKLLWRSVKLLISDGAASSSGEEVICLLSLGGRFGDAEGEEQALVFSVGLSYPLSTIMSVITCLVTGSLFYE